MPQHITKPSTGNRDRLLALVFDWFVGEEDLKRYYQHRVRALAVRDETRAARQAARRASF